MIPLVLSELPTGREGAEERAGEQKMEGERGNGELLHGEENKARNGIVEE